jgi:hypothetical protein
MALLNELSALESQANETDFANPFAATINPMQDFCLAKSRTVEGKSGEWELKMPRVVGVGNLAGSIISLYRPARFKPATI